MKAVSYIKFLSVLLVIGFTSACSSGGPSHAHIVVVDEPSPPEIFQLDMVDSYGVNSEFESDTLVVSPEVNNGEFDVFWDIHSEDDYIIQLLVSDEPSIAGSALISEEYCNEFYACYVDQYQYCNYTENLTIECQTPNGTTQSADIDHLLPTIPEDLYIILRVCDVDYVFCESAYIPVIFD